MTRPTRLLLAALAGAFAVIAMLSAQNRRLSGAYAAERSRADSLQTVANLSAARFDSVAGEARSLADTLSEQARVLARVRAQAARLGATLAAVARTAEGVAADTSVGRETLRATILALTRGIAEREAAQQIADSVSKARIADLEGSIIALAESAERALADERAAGEARVAALIAKHRAETPTRLQRVAKAGLYLGAGWVAGRLDLP